MGHKHEENGVATNKLGLDRDLVVRLLSKPIRVDRSYTTKKKMKWVRHVKYYTGELETSDGRKCPKGPWIVWHSNGGGQYWAGFAEDAVDAAIILIHESHESHPEYSVTQSLLRGVLP